MLATHLKPARVLSDPLTGARLMREIGLYDPELPTKNWLSALQAKGGIVFGTAGGPSVDCMLINGRDTVSGMGVVYAATHEGRYLRASYIPTDENGTINFDADPLGRASRASQIHTEPFIFNNITSISYHKPSHRILQTAAQARITIFEPVLSAHCPRAHAFTNETGPHPAWLLGETQSNISITMNPIDLSLRRSCAAPPAHGGSTLSALVATDRGIIKVIDSHMAWLGPQQPITPQHAQQNAMPYDVLSVDWHPTNPNICFAGNRNADFFRIDMRIPHGGPGWDRFRHRSAAAHVRAVNEYQILVAGPMNAMAIYDVRRMTAGKRGRWVKEAWAVCTMHDYVNPAYIDIGLDLTTIASECVVAAANSAGTVDVFSTRTGDKMNVGALSQVGVDGVVKCLQWEKMPWENEPSLWAGVGNTVKKLSFGLDECEDEDC